MEQEEHFVYVMHHMLALPRNAVSDHKKYSIKIYKGTIRRRPQDRDRYQFGRTHVDFDPTTVQKIFIGIVPLYANSGTIRMYDKVEFPFVSSTEEEAKELLKSVMDGKIKMSIKNGYRPDLSMAYIEPALMTIE